MHAYIFIKLKQFGTQYKTPKVQVGCRGKDDYNWGSMWVVRRTSRGFLFTIKRCASTGERGVQEDFFHTSFNL